MPTDTEQNYRPIRACRAKGSDVGNIPKVRESAGKLRTHKQKRPKKESS